MKDCGKPGCPNDHRSQCSPVATRIECLPLMAVCTRNHVRIGNVMESPKLAE